MEKVSPFPFVNLLSLCSQVPVHAECELSMNFKSVQSNCDSSTAVCIDVAMYFCFNFLCFVVCFNFHAHV